MDERNDLSDFVSKLPDVFNDLDILAEQGDDPSTPFASKYRSREIMVDTLSRIMYFKKNVESSSQFYNVLLDSEALLNYYLGMNYFETEELYEVEKTLISDSCSRRLSSNERKYFSEIQRLYHTCGVLWIRRTDYEKAIPYLLKSNRTYETIALNVVEGTTNHPLTKLYVRSLMYLSSIMEYEDEIPMSADYLNRALIVESRMSEFNHSSWIQCGLKIIEWYAAMQYVDKSEALLSECETLLESCSDNGEICVGERGEMLSDRIHLTHGCVALCKLDNLRNQIQSNCTSTQITETAKNVLENGLHHLSIAAEKFPLDGYVSTYCSIARTAARLHELAVDFESDEDNVRNHHTERTRLLEEIIIEISPRVYRDMYRQFLFDLGKSYKEWHTFEEGVSSSECGISMSEIARKGTHCFEEFLSTFGDDCHLTDTECANVNAFFFAKFSLAHMYMKITEEEKGNEGVNMKRSLQEYEDILSMMKKNTYWQEAFYEEVQLAVQMANLLRIRTKEHACRKRTPTCTFSLLSMPGILLEKILTFVPYRNMPCLMLTCKRLSSAALSNRVWASHYVATWRLHPPATGNEDHYINRAPPLGCATWRKSFQMRLKRHREGKKIIVDFEDDVESLERCRQQERERQIALARAKIVKRNGKHSLS